MAACLMFVVAALLEYAIANHKSRHEDRDKAEAKEKEQKEGVVSTVSQMFFAYAIVTSALFPHLETMTPSCDQLSCNIGLTNF
jgi:cytochrome bd-type quinol oxidase subunit 2